MTTNPEIFPGPEHEPVNRYPAWLTASLEGDEALDTTQLMPGGSLTFTPNASLSDEPCNDRETDTFQKLLAVVSSVRSDEISPDDQVFGVVWVVDISDSDRRSPVWALVDLSKRLEDGKPVVGVPTPSGEAVQLGKSLQVSLSPEDEINITDVGSAEGARLFTRKLIKEKINMPFEGSVAFAGLRRRIGLGPTRVLEHKAGVPWNDLETDVKRWAIKPQEARALLDGSL